MPSMKPQTQNHSLNKPEFWTIYKTFPFVVHDPQEAKQKPGDQFIGSRPSGFTALSSKSVSGANESPEMVSNLPPYQAWPFAVQRKPETKAPSTAALKTTDEVITRAKTNPRPGEKSCKAAVR